jgi:hypothetical protein
MSTECYANSGKLHILKAMNTPLATPNRHIYTRLGAASDQNLKLACCDPLSCRQDVFFATSRKLLVPALVVGPPPRSFMHSSRHQTLPPQMKPVSQASCVAGVLYGLHCFA